MNVEGDLVLVYYRDNPTVYARIESIEPDFKKDWYRVTFLLLTIPAQKVTWILREEYINGTSFTMGGEPMRMEGVGRIPQRATEAGGPPADDEGGSKSPKVISLKDRKK